MYWFKRLLVSAVLMIGLLFLGLAISLASPILSILYFIGIFKVDLKNSQKFNLQKFVDPDWKQKWKQDHDELYPDE